MPRSKAPSVKLQTRHGGDKAPSASFVIAIPFGVFLWLLEYNHPNPDRRRTLDIVIEVKNVSQNFKPELISLGWLRAQILKLYPKFDGKVRAIFFPANEFEFNFDTGKLVPVERISVNIYPKYVIGGMQPTHIGDFSREAAAIAYYVDVFLRNSNNDDLFLPSFVTISTGSGPAHAFPVRIK